MDRMKKGVWGKAGGGHFQGLGLDVIPLPCLPAFPSSPLPHTFLTTDILQIEVKVA